MLSRILPLLAVVSLAACGSETGESPAPAADPTETTAAPSDAAAVDPTELDLATLVGDIRSGVAPLPERVADDPARARQAAVQLYVTRQEEIERRWGPNGVAGPSPELAAAVEEAERRFHMLMELLAGDPPPDRAAVAEAIAALDASQADVLAAAP